MNDLRQRFASLDRIPRPDLWDDVERRATALDTMRVNPRVTRAGSAGSGARTSQEYPSPKIWRPALVGLVLLAVLVTLIAGAVLVGSRNAIDNLHLVAPSSAVAPAPSVLVQPSAVATALPSQVTPATSGQLHGFSSAVLSSATVGWVATPTGIFRTTDAGRTWFDVLQVPVGVARFVDEQTAFVADPTPSLAIHATHDGGTTWRSTTVAGPPNASGVLRLTFATPEEGYATLFGAGNGRLEVYTTADGGNSWSGPNEVDETHVTGYDGKTTANGDDGGVLWIGPLPRADGLSPSRVFSTSIDGGQTWVQRMVPIDPLIPTGELAQPMSVRVENDHVLLVLEGVPAVFDSVDGGSSWRRVQAWPTSERIELASMTAWAAVAADGTSIWSTFGGGSTWRTTAASTHVPSGSLTFGSADAGWIVDRSAFAPCTGVGRFTPTPRPECSPGVLTDVLWATSDGGATWTKVAP